MSTSPEFVTRRDLLKAGAGVVFLGAAACQPASQESSPSASTETVEDLGLKSLNERFEKGVPSVNNPDKKTFRELMSERGATFEIQKRTTPGYGSVRSDIGVKIRQFPYANDDDPKAELGDYDFVPWFQNGMPTSPWNYEVVVRKMIKQKEIVERFAAYHIKERNNEWGFFRLNNEETGKPREQYVYYNQQ